MKTEQITRSKKKQQPKNKWSICFDSLFRIKHFFLCSGYLFLTQRGKMPALSRWVCILYALSVECLILQSLCFVDALRIFFHRNALTKSSLLFWKNHSENRNYELIEFDVVCFIDVILTTSFNFFFLFERLWWCRLSVLMSQNL